MLKHGSFCDETARTLVIIYDNIQFNPCNNNNNHDDDRH